MPGYCYVPLDLNWQTVSASTLGAKLEKDLPPPVNLDILGIFSWPEFWDCSGCEWLQYNNNFAQVLRS